MRWPTCTLVSSRQPPFEQRRYTMYPEQKLTPQSLHAIEHRYLVLVSIHGQATVSAPFVGMNRCIWLTNILNKSDQICSASSNSDHNRRGQRYRSDLSEAIGHPALEKLYSNRQDHQHPRYRWGTSLRSRIAGDNNCPVANWLLI